MAKPTIKDGLAQVGFDTNTGSIFERRLEVHGLPNIKLSLDKCRISACSVRPVFRVAGEFAGVITLSIAKLEFR